MACTAIIEAIPLRTALRIASAVGCCHAFHNPGPNAQE
ncbi:hypothetical protein I551_2720 [Mycobacterium ulcerans str. Harvey]|uniref:Uncharacterized protein n=1 Tax=Mycobacterium ulcerans str. Harvey TaxID=1299332 RepID=A0ABN0R1D8_MYCUL|nr:hypothetical protein I551_2720 [Mycobacterium ulcerans str. Harvey]